MARMGMTVNEYGTPVTKYKCETCDGVFTVCPAPTPDNDKYWQGCTAPECGSYDPNRDIDKWFDEGRVRSVSNGDGTSRLIPFKVVR